MSYPRVRSRQSSEGFGCREKGTSVLLIDSTPETASSSLGLLIGLSLGVAGVIISPVAGYVIETYGFTWDYIMLAIACLSALIPISIAREAPMIRGTEDAER